MERKRRQTKKNERRLSMLLCIILSGNCQGFQLGEIKLPTKTVALFGRGVDRFPNLTGSASNVDPPASKHILISVNLPLDVIYVLEL